MTMYRSGEKRTTTKDQGKQVEWKTIHRTGMIISFQFFNRSRLPLLSNGLLFLVPSTSTRFPATFLDDYDKILLAGGGLFLLVCAGKPIEKLKENFWRKVLPTSKPPFQPAGTPATSIFNEQYSAANRRHQIVLYGKASKKQAKKSKVKARQPRREQENETEQRNLIISAKFLPSISFPTHSCLEST